MTDQLAQELAEEAIDVVFTVYWADTFDESGLKAEIANLFKQHLSAAKRL